MGTAVTARLLDDSWRVVVPWIVESELERIQVQAREGDVPALRPIGVEKPAARHCLGDRDSGAEVSGVKVLPRVVGGLKRF